MLLLLLLLLLLVLPLLQYGQRPLRLVHHAQDAVEHHVDVPPLVVLFNVGSIPQKESIHLLHKNTQMNGMASLEELELTQH